MSRKKMYWLLAFILFTFALLGVVVTAELNRYSAHSSKQTDSAVQDTKDGENTAEESRNMQSKDSAAEGNNTSSGGEISGSGNTRIPDDSNTVPKEDQTAEDIVLVFSGDINMTDVIQNKYSQDGIDGILSKNFQEEFKNADIAMVNQEFAFTTRGTRAEDKQYTFRTAPDYVSVFKDMQVDVATLANNHTMDFGTVGLIDTFDTLKGAGIKYAGAGNNLTEAREIKYFSKKDKKIACLGASRVIPVPEWNAYDNKPGMLTTYDPAMLIEDIKTAKSQSDYVVVYVHWGLEKYDTPVEYQRNLAKQYIDAGADLVVGSHPHVLQGIEYYKGKPVIYSLGNFMFYSSINRTALLKVSLNEQNEAKVQLIPGRAENAFTYQIEEASDIQKFYQYMTDISYGVRFDGNGAAIPEE